tara:strand:- start:36 stop:227 length:192 start_codon:yes stop_codon:yes gene_type:complete
MNREEKINFILNNRNDIQNQKHLNFIKEEYSKMLDDELETEYQFYKNGGLSFDDMTNVFKGVS